MIRFIRSLLGWRTVRDTGCWLYQINVVTGRRRIVRVGCGGHQPVDSGWLLEVDQPAVQSDTI